jgi:cyclic beta-1,2-glucan synthetase
MYRLGVETILGFTKRGDTLVIEPRVPAAWPEFTIEYRYGRSVYTIVVHDPGAVRHGEAEVTLDGRLLKAAAIPLVDDGLRHTAAVRPLRGERIVERGVDREVTRRSP